jgi:hypothetical protein
MAKNPTIMTLRRELDFQSFIRVAAESRQRR